MRLIAPAPIQIDGVPLIYALTKLNYNSCRHSDGLPVTLKFADAVGEILVSGPQKQQDPPLPFRHYI
jgi:hypothetical protein